MGLCTVNMINFIRGVEPRMPMDLVYPVKKQIELNKRYGIKNTFLIQYDAMINPQFTDLLSDNRDNNTEIGLWLEIVQPLVEAVGIKWRGRPGFAWDWHVNPGFLMAYTQKQREQLIDAAMECFKEYFGDYPHSVGSWLIDSHSMKYMSEKYPVEAFCICREQWGTDGYTLWGGYYDHAFYPSIHNMLSPAQTGGCQINVPTFRMLGFDPLDGYDNTNPMDKPSCITMEPCWPCGQSMDWVKWYMNNRIENEDLGFSYVQVGQENSFGWEQYGVALEQQLEILKLLEKEGKLVFETMSESGRKFRERYSETPPNVISAFGDFKGKDRKTVWYNCKNYRANLYSADGRACFRDIYIFNENYPERFESDICTEDACTYDTLPFVDGFLCSSENFRAGLFFDGVQNIGSIEKTGDGILKAELIGENGTVNTFFSEDKITVEGDCVLTLEISSEKSEYNAIKAVADKQVNCCHNGFYYSVKLDKGIFREENGKLCIISEDNEIIIKFK